MKSNGWKNTAHSSIIFQIISIVNQNKQWVILIKNMLFNNLESKKLTYHIPFIQMNLLQNNAKTMNSIHTSWTGVQGVNYPPLSVCPSICMYEHALHFSVPICLEFQMSNQCGATSRKSPQSVIDLFVIFVKNPGASGTPIIDTWSYPPLKNLLLTTD